MNPEEVRRSAQTVSHTGALLESAAHAAKPTTSPLGRVGAAISIARLGARLLPEARRLFRRYPLVSALTVAGMIGAMYLSRSARHGAAPGSQLARFSAGSSSRART